MNVVASSAWLEFFADGPNASAFAGACLATDELVVPTVCLYEVYKRVAAQRDEPAALQAVAVMLQGRVIDLSTTLALSAARVSQSEGLPMADAIILASARSEGAVLWTQDSHFASREGVEYRAK